MKHNHRINSVSNSNRVSMGYVRGLPATDVFCEFHSFIQKLHPKYIYAIGWQDPIQTPSILFNHIVLTEKKIIFV